MLNWLFQYILGYCTSWGLAAIGEPPLTESLPHAVVDTAATQATRIESKEPTPAWIIPIFMALVAGRYITSFLVSFYGSFFNCSSRVKKKEKKRKNHTHISYDIF